MMEIEIIFTGFSLSSSVLVYFLTMYKKILTLWCVILFNFQQLAIFLDGYKRENTSCHNLYMKVGSEILSVLLFFFWTNCNVNQGRHNCGINKSFFRVISKNVKKMDRYLFKSSPRIIAKNYLLRNLNEILRDENFYIKDKYWLKAFRWGWARLLHWLFVIYWWDIFISFRFCFVL